MGDRSPFGEESELVEGFNVPPTDVGAPETSADDLASSSLFDSAPWMGNSLEAAEPAELRSPAHYVSIVYMKGGRAHRRTLPWVRGKRLQYYLKDAGMVSARMRCRMTNTAHHKLRMSHLPGPGEEIYLVSPNTPFSYRAR